MAKRIGQVRFFSNGASNNYPANMTSDQISRGAPFANKKIVQLGIQTLPGTKFAINHNASWIVVGMTGIYELNVEGLTAITALNFDVTSIKNISDNSAASLVIDYLYEDGEN